MNALRAMALACGAFWTTALPGVALAGPADNEPEPPTETTVPAGATVVEEDAAAPQEPEHEHLVQQRRADLLVRYAGVETLAQQATAHACRIGLESARRDFESKQPTEPDLRLYGLPDPPRKHAAVPAKAHQMLNDAIGEATAFSGHPSSEWKKRFGELDTALRLVASIDLSAELDAATALGDEKLRELAVEQLTAFERDVAKALKAINAYRADVDNWLAGKVPIPDVSLTVATVAEANTIALAKKHRCSANDRLCLTLDGTLLGANLDEDSIEPGLIGRLKAKARVTVLVFADASAGEDTDGETRDSITIKMGQIERTSQLTRAPIESAATQSLPDACDHPVPEKSVGYHLVKSEILTVPDDISVRHAVVEFERKGADNDVVVKAQHSARVDHGRYYVDVGILVPFVPRGRRAIVGVEDNGAQFVGVDERLHVTGALALHVFPGGRRKDALSPFEDLRCDSRLRGDEWRSCRNRAIGRPIAELIGIQLGIDFNGDLTDQFYIGAVLEPVTGLTFGTGVAILEVDRLPVRVVTGQLVTGASDLQPRSQHVPRWYGGFTISYDLVRFVQQARARFEGAK